MPYFALTYDVVDDFVNRRMPFRPAHIKEVRDAHARGELVMAGALGEPAGALLVFRAADRATQRISRKPIRTSRSGLVRNWQVRPWTVVVGQDPSETPPGLPPK